MSDLDLYALLGAAPDASGSELSRCYERAVAHAQRAGAYRTVEQLSRAYTILSRPESRATYDDLGVALAPERVPGTSNPATPFRSIKPGLGQAPPPAGRSAAWRAGRVRDRIRPAESQTDEATRQRQQALAQRYEQGALGEQLVAEALRPLADQGWTLLHDRCKPGSPANLDHLLVGPGGVVVLDAKNWTGGRVRLDSRGLAVAQWRKDDALVSARIDVQVVRDALRRKAPQVPVIGGLALVHDMGLDGPVLHQGAFVVQRCHLLAWLEALPQVLAPAQAQALAEDVAAIFAPKLAAGPAWRARQMPHRSSPGTTSRRPQSRRGLGTGDKVRIGLFLAFFAAVYGGLGPTMIDATKWVTTQFVRAAVPSLITPAVTPKPSPDVTTSTTHGQPTTTRPR